MKPTRSHRLIRTADSFLPAALLVATLLGRDAIATDFFLAYMLVRLCALSTCTGLRAAFATQPSMRYAQGSTLVALLMNLAGAGIALPIFPANHPHRLLLIACGLLINIEHMFYEYMVAEGDGGSATLSRSITAALVLTGLLLSCPPWKGKGNPAVFSPVYIVVTTGLSALVGLAISLSMGGRLRPKLNGQVLKSAPTAMLQTALYPGLALLIIAFSDLDIQTFMPLFAGLVLYELCRTPFRRTPAEALPFNRALLVVAAACGLGILPFALGFAFHGESRLLNDIPYALGGIILASICAFALYGNIKKRDKYE